MPITRRPRVSTKGLAKDPRLAGYGPEFRFIWRTYVQASLSRGTPFLLSPEQFQELIDGNCVYCGMAPQEVAYGELRCRYSGIDRVRNDMGYQEGNVVSCCKRCNSMKSELSAVEFLRHIRRIVAWQDGLFGS